jgi:HEAT repeat protein
MNKQTVLALMFTTVLAAGSVEAQPTGAPPKEQPPAAKGQPPAPNAAKLAGVALIDVDAAVTLAQEMALVAGARASLVADHAELASRMALVAGAHADAFHMFDPQSSAAEQEKAREMAARDRERDRENRAYEEAYAHAREARYERAVERFNEVLSLKGSKADAALYWKAYSQDRLGQRAEALATIATLTREHAKSPYLQQARLLEAEVRRNAGQPARPQDQADEDLKLMALNALQHQAPEEAVPMIEKLLASTASPKLKERALFVLAQSNSAQARAVLKRIAQGSATPELQSRAISYLGMHGGAESRAILSEVYASTTDVDIKKRILRAFMTGGEKNRLLSAAQSEQNAELRATAVQQLGMMGAHAELTSLYQKETTVEVKKQIIRAMFMGGNSAKMIELAKSEQNPDLRREAIRNLGMMGSKGTAEALVEIYNADKDINVRKAVIQALAMNDNAEALVALARKEQDPAMKAEIVRRLSTMNSKVAINYMLEILNK